MYRDHDQRAFAKLPMRNSACGTFFAPKNYSTTSFKFRRQAAIGSYVVDFVCYSARLIFELDGPQHLDPDAARHDKQRTSWLRSRGFELIRFRNQELDENIHAVVDVIASSLAELERRAESPPSPALPAEGREPEVGD